MILLLVVLGTLSGCTSYTSLEEFAQRHYQALVAHLGLPYKRLPSDSTVRRALMGVNFQQLAEVFIEWAQVYVRNDESRWFAVDGKALKGSVVNPCDAHQQFVSLVSVFSQSQGIAVAVEQYQNHEDSKIQVVERLLASLDLQAVTYTMDALHCQKNTSNYS